MKSCRPLVALRRSQRNCSAAALAPIVPTLLDGSLSERRQPFANRNRTAPAFGSGSGSLEIVRSSDLTSQSLRPILATRPVNIFVQSFVRPSAITVRSALESRRIDLLRSSLRKRLDHSNGSSRSQNQCLAPVQPIVATGRPRGLRPPSRTGILLGDWWSRNICWRSLASAHIRSIVP